MAARVYCAKCGGPLAPGARFCAECGQEHASAAPGVLGTPIPTPPIPPRKGLVVPDLRGFSYLIGVVDGLLLIATVLGFGSRTEAGQQLGFLFDLIAWAAIDVILLTLWIVTDRRPR